MRELIELIFQVAIFIRLFLRPGAKLAGIAYPIYGSLFTQQKIPLPQARSLGFSNARGALSIQQPVHFSAKAGEVQMWSIRKPWFRLPRAFARSPTMRIRGRPRSIRKTSTNPHCFT